VRIAAGLLTVLCAGALFQQAWAADPPVPSPPPAAPAPAAPASDAQQSSAAPAADKSAAAPSTPESTPAKPTITVVGTKPELTSQEKELLSRGYKLEMRHGDKYFCRTESDIESRFPRKNCDTAESIEAHRQASQEVLRTIQSDRPQVGK